MRYIETIKLIDGVPQNIDNHHKRIFRTIGRDIDFECDTTLNGVVKYRIVYDESGIIEEQFIPYQLPDISSLKLIECNEIEYNFKYEDRTFINEIMAQRGGCDDVIIVKNGFLTDTSFGNIVLENEEGLFTPITFLLKGTKRDQLLKNGTIKSREITINNYDDYHTIYIVNAMIELGDVIIRTSSNNI